VDDLYQQQATSPVTSRAHQGYSAVKQVLQVKALNDSPGCCTGGWICHSQIKDF